MKRLLLLIYLFFLSIYASANEVHFKTTDNAIIYADLQKRGDHAVLLAHGAIFNKHSWGEFAQQLLDNNYTVLAIDFRGYGQSTLGEQSNALFQDILAGVHYLHAQTGITRVSVLGASMGGGAAAKACVYSEPGAIDQLILLSPASIYHPAKLTAGSVLFIASEDEYLATKIKAAFKEALKPKALKLISGSAHAQHIFKTPQAESLTNIILDFLRQS